jgi:hypothetical protein
MTRKATAIMITDIQEHEADCVDHGAHGRFDQEYTLPEPWMAELLGHVTKAHGARAFVRAQRGTKTTLVLKAHDIEALKRTNVDFMRFLPELDEAITRSVRAFCATVPTRIASPPPAAR